MPWTILIAIPVLLFLSFVLGLSIGRQSYASTANAVRRTADDALEVAEGWKANYELAMEAARKWESVARSCMLKGEANAERD